MDNRRHIRSLSFLSFFSCGERPPLGGKFSNQIHFLIEKFNHKALLVASFLLKSTCIWDTPKCNNVVLKVRKKVNSNQPPTYVTDDCYFSDAVQDVKPDSDVLSSVGDRSSHFTHKLVGVDSDLEDVVGKREKWSQWECSHKDGDETELENCEEQFNRTTLSIIRDLKVVDKYTKQNEDCSRARP